MNRYRAFTVDRTSRLSVGATLDLVRHRDINLPFLQIHADEMFPSGVMEHGSSYFLNGDQHAALSNPSIELLWEYVRRSAFNSRPSRFQVIFACETEADARRWRSIYGRPVDPIYEVESQEVPFRADMTLLTVQDSILVTSYRANIYWRGETVHSAPLWELLMRPPVKVVRVLEEN